MCMVHISYQSAYSINTVFRLLYWSSLGSTSKIQKASMNGSGASTVLNITGTFVFTIDYTQQVFYWIIRNWRCNNNIIGHANIDGSERREIVVRSDTSCSNSFGYNPQAIDFFGGALYSFSNYNNKLFKIELEGETTVFTFDGNYLSCRILYTGMKVISLQRQQQGIVSVCIHFKVCFAT